MRRPKINTEYLGLFAALLVGTLSVNSMPLLVGGVIAGLQLNPANAGLLASMELGAVAATTLYLSRNLCAFDFRALGWWGASLAFMGNSSCWLTLSEFIPQTSFASLNGQQLDGKVGVLMMGRLVAGVGAGAALAAFSGAIAGLTDPDRKYAKVLVANVTLIGFVMAVLIPHLERGHSYRGTFTALALVNLVAIALMRYLPSRMALSQVHHSRVENKMAGTLLIVSLSVFAIGEGAVWAFVEQVGRSIRFESNGVAMSISSVIGVASIVGVVVGAGAAAVLGLKYGRKRPLLFALLVFGVAGPFLASSSLRSLSYRLAGSVVNVWDGRQAVDSSLDDEVRCIDRLFRETCANADVSLDEIRLFITNNYSLEVSRLYCQIANIRFSKAFTQTIATHAHCFGSDNLINLHHANQSGLIAEGECAMLFSAGPHQWGACVIEALGSVRELEWQP
jgi:hypothetical protein